MRRLGPLVLLVGLAGCEGDADCPDDILSVDQECTTSLDCADANLAGLTCIDGRCRLACLRDEDCRPTEGDTESCGVPTGQSAVCEGQVCVPGCPDRACPEGQSVCADGRCAYAYEGFESEGDTAPTLAGLGWNDLGRELENLQTTIAFAGAGSCTPGPNCGGPAARGDRFVLLGTQPTPEKGTPLTTTTCRACACCLECRLDPPLQAPAVTECPTELSFPPRLICGPATRCDETPPDETTIPAVCTDLCARCDACEAAPSAPAGALLSACEAQAAGRVCPACEACDAEACRSCREAQCADACVDRQSEACLACEVSSSCPCTSCRDCGACADARACREGGGASDRCARLQARCDGLGTDGCFAVPSDYPRAQLAPGEQALESFAIDLSRATGDVRLELSYVSFNVGDTYLPGIQGTSVCAWTRASQEVVVQTCSADCAAESSWSDAEFVGGERAAFPPASQRGNGLPFGSQSLVDWRSGRLEVAIPPERRTAGFRFRLLPRLSENASVGVDEIIVREAR